MRRALIAVAAFLICPGAAQAATETSRGIQAVTTIPERGVVSARAVGRHLYVSSLTGVTIFDISRPRAPVRVGRLDLPNAQNEDVDVGSGILLVSDDPFGGRGILHVVDVRDPAQPRVISALSTWAPGVMDFFDPPRRGGIGHTATCIPGPPSAGPLTTSNAIRGARNGQCRYAWLAGSAAGIDIVDLRDPARPRLVRRFAAEAAAGPFGTHDVQVDSRGLAWVTGGAGTAAYDVSDPVRPRLVRRTDRRGGRSPLNDFIHHNALRLRRNVVAITEEDFRTGCRRAGTLQTWRFGRGRLLRPLDSFGVERDRSAQVMCSAHYFDARRGLIAQGFYEQGVRLIDARRPGRLRQVGYYVRRPGLFWGAVFAPTDRSGSTVYALDHSRGIDVLALNRSALRPVRRRGARRRRARPRRGFALAITDGFDAVRPGQRLRVRLGVAGRGGGPVQVTATLPPELVEVQAPAGVAFDPATRTLRFTLRRVGGFAVRTVRARVGPAVALQTPLEVIGFASGPADPLPLDDRGVDRGIVRRTSRSTGPAAAARAGPRRWFCALPSDYTL